MATSAQPAPARVSLDVVGATTSLACAIHCAVVALALGMTPIASLIAASWIEWAFLAASAAIGVFALVPGYRRHGLRTPLALFALGIALLVTLRALRVPASVLEMLVVVVAAGCLISAHWMNRGATHRCACGPLHHA
jgi:MerC mercury resistance protein